MPTRARVVTPYCAKHEAYHITQHQLHHLRLADFRTRSMRFSRLRKAPVLAAVQAIATEAHIESKKSKLQQLYQQAQISFGRGKQPSSPEDLQAVSQALREYHELRPFLLQIYKTKADQADIPMCQTCFRRDPIAGARYASGGALAAAHTV